MKKIKDIPLQWLYKARYRMRKKQIRKNISFDNNSKTASGYNGN